MVNCGGTKEEKEKEQFTHKSERNAEQKAESKEAAQKRKAEQFASESVTCGRRCAKAITVHGAAINTIRIHTACAAH